MCQELIAKIAIIRRVSRFAPRTRKLEWIAYMLGTEVPEPVVKYVNLATNTQIMQDIAAQLPIAIELDNLQVNWLN